VIAGKTTQPTVITPTISIHPNDITMQTVDVTFSPEYASAPTTYTVSVNDFYGVVTNALMNKWGRGLCDVSSGSPISGDICFERKGPKKVTITAFSTQVDINYNDLYALDDFFNDIITTRNDMRDAVGDSFMKTLQVSAKNESPINICFSEGAYTSWVEASPLTCDGVFITIEFGDLDTESYRLSTITRFAA